MMAKKDEEEEEEEQDKIGWGATIVYWNRHSMRFTIFIQLNYKMFLYLLSFTKSK